MQPFIDIAIGVLKKGNQYCLSQRKKSQSFADKWEFPGGKVEQDEAIEEALIREFSEELGVTTSDWQPFITIPWHYETVSVRLHVFKSTQVFGEPYGKEGQAVEWFSLDELLKLDFPEANQGILTAMQVQDFYLLTSKKQSLAENIKTIRAAMQQQPITCQLYLHEKLLKEANKADLTSVQLLLDEAKSKGSQVLLSGSTKFLKKLKGFAGVHISSNDLETLSKNDVNKPNLKQALLGNSSGLLAVSVHNQTEFDLAMTLPADIVLLSPVKPSFAHPDIKSLGWKVFSEMVSHVPVPVYALGGMMLGDLFIAKQYGARGIASRKLA